MASASVDELQMFQWKPCPEGQRLVDLLISDHLEQAPKSRQLASAMADQTGTRFLDWLDHLVTDRPWLIPDLEGAGFTPAAAPALRVDGERTFASPLARRMAAQASRPGATRAGVRTPAGLLHR